MELLLEAKENSLKNKFGIHIPKLLTNTYCDAILSSEDCLETPYRSVEDTKENCEGKKITVAK